MAGTLHRHPDTSRGQQDTTAAMVCTEPTEEATSMRPERYSPEICEITGPKATEALIIEPSQTTTPTPSESNRLENPPLLPYEDVLSWTLDNSNPGPTQEAQDPSGTSLSETLRALSITPEQHPGSPLEQLRLPPIMTPQEITQEALTGEDRLPNSEGYTFVTPSCVARDGKGLYCSRKASETCPKCLLISVGFSAIIALHMIALHTDDL